MTFLKILGAGLIIASGGFLGFLKFSELKNHTRVLESLYACLGIVKNEIEQRQTSLPNAFSALEREKPECVGSFFFSVSQSIATGEPLQTAWGGQVEALPLNEEEKRALLPLGEVLGRFEARRQGREIEFARQSLAAYIDASKKREQQTGKNSLGLGVSVGAMIAIILM